MVVVLQFSVNYGSMAGLITIRYYSPPPNILVDFVDVLCWSWLLDVMLIFKNYFDVVVGLGYRTTSSSAFKFTFEAQ